jgi:hypothetical protein
MRAETKVMKMPGGPRWMWWTGLAVGLLVLVTVIAALFIDEPARRYMERKINSRLTGYTVAVPKLHVHPWTVSLELVDATLRQDANPDPPVALFRSLRASLHWNALIHGKIVATITFDRPALYVNLKHLQAEVASDVPLKDRGWQDALEAVALDLKIDKLQVRNGELTYVDAGPFKPLRLTRINANANNIRNIKSKDREYPSDLHLEAVVFDSGKLWLDGHADFLAEPHTGIQAALKLEQIELDYFKPVTNRYNLSVSKGTLSLAGDIEYAPTITKLALDRVAIQGVHLEYIHKPGTAQAEQVRKDQTVKAAKQVADQPDIELRINRVEVTKSTFALVNRAASPEYRVDLTDADLVVENLSNQRIEGASVARLKGRFMGSGETQATLTLRPRKGGYDTQLSARVENADMVRMNNLVHNYGGFEVAAGEMSVYTELQVTNDIVTGYVKPLFRDVKVATPEGEPKPTLGRRLYQGAVGLAAKILKNHPRREVATVVTISGRADQPVYNMWGAVGHLLQNAFIKAILPGFDPERKEKAEPQAVQKAGSKGSSG